MKISLKTKLITSFLVVVLMTGCITTVVGVKLIAKRIVAQAQEKVRLDLNAARELYGNSLGEVSCPVRFTAVRFFVADALRRGDIESVATELEGVRRREHLDILTVTDPRGRVLLRARNPKCNGDSQAEDPIVGLVLRSDQMVSGTEVLSREELLKEGEDIADRACVKIVPTPLARRDAKSVETSGMVLKAAAPIKDSRGNLTGVLYGARLLNKDCELVDRIKGTLYRGETDKAKDMGAATIFMGDLRIATNVKNEAGERAIGTRVSEEVYQKVLEEGRVWQHRAFVVNDWYIAAYEPIRNVAGKAIGMLYVGVLERQFTELQRRAVWAFLTVTFAGMLVAVALSYVLANSIVKPVRKLASAAREMAQGDYSHRVEVRSKDEMAELAEAFNTLMSSIRSRDRKLEERTQQIMESKKLATLGQLAAGVAHELNTPLGAILIYGHLLLEERDLDEAARQNLHKIVKEAGRCRDIVKGLLDYSRQTEPKLERRDINAVVNAALGLVEHQAIFQNIEIVRELSDSLPPVVADAAQLEEVFMNIVLNAVEAMDEHGQLTVATRRSKTDNYVEIEFRDTGCGIPKEHLDRVFDPFFTTKDVGYGTGLGLSIAYGIVERHRGRIRVMSKEGEGTTFIVSLPAA